MATKKAAAKKPKKPRGKNKRTGANLPPLQIIGVDNGVPYDQRWRVVAKKAPKKDQTVRIFGRGFAKTVTVFLTSSGDVSWDKFQHDHVKRRKTLVPGVFMLKVRDTPRLDHGLREGVGGGDTGDLTTGVSNDPPHPPQPGPSSTTVSSSVVYASP
jgi:hypothetical protein